MRNYDHRRMMEVLHHLARRNREMLDLVVIVVTMVSFALLIGFTVGCDRL